MGPGCHSPNRSPPPEVRLGRPPLSEQLHAIPELAQAKFSSEFLASLERAGNSAAASVSPPRKDIDTLTLRAIRHALSEPFGGLIEEYANRDYLSERECRALTQMMLMSLQSDPSGALATVRHSSHSASDVTSLELERYSHSLTKQAGWSIDTINDKPLPQDFLSLPLLSVVPFLTAHRETLHYLNNLGASPSTKLRALAAASPIRLVDERCSEELAVGVTCHWRKTDPLHWVDTLAAAGVQVALITQTSSVAGGGSNPSPEADRLLRLFPETVRVLRLETHHTRISDDPWIRDRFPLVGQPKSISTSPTDWHLCSYTGETRETNFAPNFIREYLGYRGWHLEQIIEGGNALPCGDDALIVGSNALLGNWRRCHTVGESFDLLRHTAATMGRPRVFIVPCPRPAPHINLYHCDLVATCIDAGVVVPQPLKIEDSEYGRKNAYARALAAETLARHLPVYPIAVETDLDASRLSNSVVVRSPLGGGQKIFIPDAVINTGVQARKRESISHHLRQLGLKEIHFVPFDSPLHSGGALHCRTAPIPVRL